MIYDLVIVYGVVYAENRQLFMCIYTPATFDLTDSTENATPLKSTRFKNSNSSVQIQIKPKSRFGFLPRDTEDSEFLDLMDFGDVVFSVETAIFNVEYLIIVIV